MIYVFSVKPQFNKPDGTKNVFFITRGFVIAGVFFYEINYADSESSLLLKEFRY